jgi:L-ascorbate metabolism protein UlaG (beta-lactamase superfamily)
MQITWFGHSAFRLEFAGNVVLIDPFFTGNPGFEGDVAKAGDGATHILLTHGHADHIGDTVAIAARTGAKVVGNYELCMWLSGKGVRSVDPMNTGGTTDQDGFTVTLVRADHSSTFIEEDGTYVSLGHPNGVVITAAGEPTVYHMGDTDVFGDMALIQELHRPDLLIVPIGDRFTMGATRAAFAVRRFFSPRAVLPCHFGSFPIIAPDASGFIEAMAGSDVQVVTPHKNMPITIVL